ncbi:MAG: hypothetical protein JWM09_541 [Francisellaceae bacterium]|nr:hypothetical protein [Francisellaceae bacterium]
MEHDAKNDLIDYKMTKLEQAELLISKFEDILSNYKNTKFTAKFKSMSHFKLDNLIRLCDEYNACSKYKHLYILYIRNSKN